MFASLHPPDIKYGPTYVRRDDTNVMSYFAIALALCNKLEMDGRRTSKTNNKYHHR